MVGRTNRAAVTINENELIEFLTNARATFGVFRVKILDGSTRIFFMNIGRGVEFYQADHLANLKDVKSSNNMNSPTTASKQIDWNKVCQFVHAGRETNTLILLFRWDKLEPEHFKKFVNYFRWHNILKK